MAGGRRNQQGTVNREKTETNNQCFHADANRGKYPYNLKNVLLSSAP